jgi:hypothetical protein
MKRVCAKSECSIEGKSVCCKDCDKYNECEDPCEDVVLFHCEYAK